MKTFILLVLSIVGLVAIAYIAVPNHYNPFKPLKWGEPTTFATRFKIAALKDDNKQCRALLKASNVKFSPISDKETGQSCGLFGAILLEQSAVSYGGNITLTCPALVSLLLWEERHLLKHTRNVLGQELRKVEHYGTYACRNINNASLGKRSQHAYANAIDIAGFRLADNSVVSVLKHYSEDSKEGEFLRRVKDDACKYFNVVLGPEYNELHRDHFHFDMGSSIRCQ